MVERLEVGVRRIPSDDLAQAGRHDERTRAPCQVLVTSCWPPEPQVRAPGVTWRDQEILWRREPARPRGFGHEVPAAMQRRRDFLAAPDSPGSRARASCQCPGFSRPSCSTTWRPQGAGFRRSRRSHTDRPATDSASAGATAVRSSSQAGDSPCSTMAQGSAPCRGGPRSTSVLDRGCLRWSGGMSVSWQFGRLLPLDLAGPATAPRGLGRQAARKWRTRHAQQGAPDPMRDGMSGMGASSIRLSVSRSPMFRAPCGAAT